MHLIIQLNIASDQSKCREGSTMTVSVHQNFKLNIRIDICTDFKQQGMLEKFSTFAFMLFSGGKQSC